MSVSEGGADYLTSVSEYLNVESGFPPTSALQFDPAYRFIRMGRDLAAYTHVDVAPSGILCRLSGACGDRRSARTRLIPISARGPNTASARFGGPGRCWDGSRDGNACAESRLVPQVDRQPAAAPGGDWRAGAGANLTHQHPMPQAAAALHHDVLNSAALPIIHSPIRHLPVAAGIPRGSAGTSVLPHRTRDRRWSLHHCDQVLLRWKSADSAAAAGRRFGRHGAHPRRSVAHPYTGSDRDQLTINGELSKLAWNISAGHGIHAGIHFRSSTYYSILLGEQVGLACCKIAPTPTTSRSPSTSRSSTAPPRRSPTNNSVSPGRLFSPVAPGSSNERRPTK